MGDKLSSFKSKMRRLPGGVKIIALLIILLLWALSGFYTVQPSEVGIVQRFGAFNRTADPGLHYHLPFPIETVKIPNVEQVRRVEIGFKTKTASGRQDQSQIIPVPEEALMFTGDENIVDVQVTVQYNISNPQNYLFKLELQNETVKFTAQAAMRDVIGNNQIDNALTTGKEEIQDETTKLLQATLDKYESGIRVLNVQLQAVLPPKEVRDAFKDVTSAREDKNRYINEAEAYHNDIIPEARGQAAATINEASAYKENLIRKATGEASRFTSLAEQYLKAKDITEERLYLELMEEILQNPNIEKIIMSDEALRGVVPYLPLDRLSKPSTGTE